MVARAEPGHGHRQRLAFGAYGAIRYRDARIILRYRRNIRRLPRYVMTSKDVPVSQQRLFVGRGFLWEQKHASADADVPASSAATSSRRRPTG